MNPGDLLGTGTISGTTQDALGSMLEGSWRGSREIPLANSTETPAMRKFLKDGDTVIMSGFAQGEGYRIGFGDVSGKILPAGSTTKEAAARQAQEEAEKTNPNQPRDLKLYSYWRSTSSWRVRVAMALKGLAYEYRSIDLLPVSYVYFLYSLYYFIMCTYNMWSILVVSVCIWLYLLTVYEYLSSTTATITTTAGWQHH